MDEREKTKDPELYELKQEAAKWEAQQQAEKARQERISDPKRQRAFTLATRDLTDLRLDNREFATVGEIEEAEYRMLLAMQGDLELFQKMTNGFRQRYADALAKIWPKDATQQKLLSEEVNYLRVPVVL